jgi:Protein of unknown function (DUF2637)
VDNGTGLLERAMTGMRKAALAAITLLVAAASLSSFTESYRALLDWASGHGLHGVWALAWPLQVDTFIAVGELALFVALADSWSVRSRAAAWTVTLIGLAVSVAGNVGHVAGPDVASRLTASVPPLAAAAALAVGLGVLKRVVASRARPVREQPAAPFAMPARTAPADNQDAARMALAASVAAGYPISQRQMIARFGLTRAAERKVRQAVLAQANGHAAGEVTPEPC